jgi:hypothetical protein
MKHIQTDKKQATNIPGIMRRGIFADLPGSLPRPWEKGAWRVLKRLRMPSGIIPLAEGVLTWDHSVICYRI